METLKVAELGVAAERGRDDFLEVDLEVLDLALRLVWAWSAELGWWDGGIRRLTVGVVDEGSVDVESDLVLVSVLRKLAPARVCAVCRVLNGTRLA